MVGAKCLIVGIGVQRQYKEEAEVVCVVLD